MFKTNSIETRERLQINQNHRFTKLVYDNHAKKPSHTAENYIEVTTKIEKIIYDAFTDLYIRAIETNYIRCQENINKKDY